MLDRHGPHRRRGRGRVDPPRAGHHLERPARPAPQPGHDGRGRSGRPGVARRGVDRGADCPEAIRARFEAKFGLPVLATYGLSEAPTVVAIDRRDGGHVPGASGRPLPHLAASPARRVDAAGEGSGEICIAPATTATAYARLLGAAERHRRGAGRRRAAHRRPRLPRRRRLPAPPGPQEPAHHPRAAPTSIRPRWSGCCWRPPGWRPARCSASPTSASGERVVAVVECAGASTRRPCGRTAWPTWRGTRSPSGSRRSTRCPATPWARSSAPSSRPCSNLTVVSFSVPLEADRARMRAERHAKLQDQAFRGPGPQTVCCCSAPAA